MQVEDFGEWLASLGPEDFIRVRDVLVADENRRRQLGEPLTWLQIRMSGIDTVTL